jgi:hypothetical protein
MTVLRLAQNLSTSPRLEGLVRFLDSHGQATMSDLHYCADADHPVARRTDTDSSISSADILRFIDEVDTIIDVTLSLRPNSPDESHVTVCAVDSIFFEVDASAAILTSLRAPILKRYAADHSRNH